MHSKSEYIRLKKLINKRTTTIILGAGASKAINPKSPTWEAAVLRALNAARYIYLGDSEASRRYDELKALIKTDKSKILQVADVVARGLAAPDSGPWRSFLNSAFGRLRPTDKTLALVLKDFGARIATTNYDTLIEKSLGMKSALLSDKNILDMLDRSRDRVFHIHGVYNKPQSILWTSSDYTNRLSSLLDIHIQNRISERGVVMIGCGGTLDDPNFQQWRRFISQASRFGGAYRLYCAAEAIEPSSDHIDICYGDNYSDLTGFLISLLPRIYKSKYRSEKSRQQEALPAKEWIKADNHDADNHSGRTREEIIELTAEIVASFVANNSVPKADIPALIRATHNALTGVEDGNDEF